MKRRQGFVSNSSTSSFCIYGLSLEQEEFFEYFGKYDETVDGYEEGDLEDDELIYAQYKKLFKDNNKMLFQNGTYDYDDNTYIGIELKTIMNDDALTIKEIKEKIKNEINSKTIKKIPDEKFGVYEESWSDR